MCLQLETSLSMKHTKVKNQQGVRTQWMAVALIQLQAEHCIQLQTSLLEGHCPANFSSNQGNLIMVLLGILETSRQVC